MDTRLLRSSLIATVAGTGVLLVALTASNLGLKDSELSAVDAKGDLQLSKQAQCMDGGLCAVNARIDNAFRTVMDTNSEAGLTTLTRIRAQ